MTFELTFADLLYTVSYAVNIASFMAKKMFWLRLGVLIATIGFLIFSVMLANPSMILWNSAFVLVNTYQLIRLILENREIKLEPLLEHVYQKVFSDISKRDFLFFWELGFEKKAENKQIMKKGEIQGSLYFLVEGELEVFKDQKSITLIAPHSFIGEMSFLTGDSATADVMAAKPVLLQEWNTHKIRSLKKLKPQLFLSVLHILGADVSKKLSRWN